MRGRLGPIMREQILRVGDRIADGRFLGGTRVGRWGRARLQRVGHALSPVVFPSVLVVHRLRIHPQQMNCKMFRRLSDSELAAAVFGHAWLRLFGQTHIRAFLRTTRFAEARFKASTWSGGSSLDRRLSAVLLSRD